MSQMSQQAISEQAFLQSYNASEFKAPLTCVDLAIFTLIKDQLHLLMVKRAQHPELGKWALPGGFIDMEKDKDLEATAKRKLFEKTGVKTPYVEQVLTTGNLKRDKRGWSISIAYFALIDASKIKLIKDDSSEEIQWFPLVEIMKKNGLAFDHKKILKACHERLVQKVEYTSLPIHLLPEHFTLTELQRVFEIILDKPVAKKSFRKRIIDADILEETGQMKKGSHRPAMLYKLQDSIKASHYFNRNLEGKRNIES